MNSTEREVAFRQIADAQVELEWAELRLLAAIQGAKAAGLGWDPIALACGFSGEASARRFFRCLLLRNSRRDGPEPAGVGTLREWRRYLERDVGATSTTAEP